MSNSVSAIKPSLAFSEYPSSGTAALSQYAPRPYSRLDAASRHSITSIVSMLGWHWRLAFYNRTKDKVSFYRSVHGAWAVTELSVKVVRTSAAARNRFIVRSISSWRHGTPSTAGCPPQL